MEYFKYMVDLLKENNAEQIQIFGGGGGVIVQNEIDELHEYGVKTHIHTHTYTTHTHAHRPL
jgi:methylmalonyl-CoA mutase